MELELKSSISWTCLPKLTRSPSSSNRAFARSCSSCVIQGMDKLRDGAITRTPLPFVSLGGIMMFLSDYHGLGKGQILFVPALTQTPQSAILRDLRQVWRSQFFGQ